jgi:hypothetical protein
MIDRFERFVVYIMTPLNGLAFIFILLNGMIGIAILADVLGSRVLLFTSCGVFLTFLAACSAVMYRHNLRHKEELAGTKEQAGKELDQRHRLPLYFIRDGGICVAGYFWGILPAMYWPSAHPFRGEISIRCMAGLLLAAASASVMVGFAGLADPRICFAVHRSTRKLPLPIWARIAAWTLVLGGFAAGGYVAYLIAK